VEAVHFRAAAFTNLTQDHLDFHGDMAAYGAAKARLFLDLSPGVSVVNIDDDFGHELAARIKGPLVRVSSQSGSDADVAPTSVHLEPNRTRAVLRTPRGNVDLDSALIGAHNLSNMVVCIGIAAAVGLDLAATASALSDASVPGRLERCDGPQDDLVVVVDYAHTPDALERVLSALTVLREGTSSAGRLICVFGCGGDRDPKKRAPMGQAVAKWADIAVVTNDNPRTEDPEAIAKAILPGLEHARAVVVELDRARAIAGAISGAKPGDVVLIAGKGHETYQIVGNVARHFDDREQARAALARRREGTDA
jgi:UDP-N-acetylmuramoyl-L-alanyl-D-glutamate--2,6-diaminopimelate ligase